MNRFYDMAKFFLILFSLLLTFSVGVFFFDQVLSPQSDKVVNLDTSIEDEEAKEPTKIVVQSNKTTPSAIKTFYKNKIRPLVKKILSDEEVEVKTNTEIAKPDSDVSPTEEKSEEALTFAEMLAKEEATRKEPAKPKAADKSKAAAKPVTTQTKTAETNQVKKTTETVKKVDSTPSTPKKPALQKYTTPEGWCIQIAAFKGALDAEKVADDLTKNRYPNFIYQTEINGNTWYRVNIGPFDSPGAAATFKQSRGIGQKFKGAFVKKL